MKPIVPVGLVTIAVLGLGVVLLAGKMQPKPAIESPAPVAFPSPTAAGSEVFPAEATWYGAAYEGKLTAAGAHKAESVPPALWRFDMFAMTCAHPTLEFGTWVRVWFLSRFVECMVTDRPAPGVHVIDLSAAAFHALCPLQKGRIAVVVEVLP